MNVARYTVQRHQTRITERISPADDYVSPGRRATSLPKSLDRTSVGVDETDPFGLGSTHAIDYGARTTFPSGVRDKFEAYLLRKPLKHLNRVVGRAIPANNEADGDIRIHRNLPIKVAKSAPNRRAFVVSGYDDINLFGQILLMIADATSPKLPSNVCR